MSVETIKVELEVGKETKEVVDAIFEIFKDIRAKKGIADIAAENLPGLMQAVEGFDELDDEQSHASKHGTRAYLAKKISEALDA